MATILLIGLILTITISIIAVIKVDDSNQIESNHHHHDTTEHDNFHHFDNDKSSFQDSDGDGIPDFMDFD